MKIDGLGVQRGGRAARRQVRRPAALPGGHATGPAQRPSNLRPRMLEAHKVAQAYYAEHLATPGGGRRRAQFLDQRGFDKDAAETFGVGFAPRGGDDALQAPAAEGLQRRGAGHRRPGRPGQPRPLRPVPRPAAVADPRDQRRRDRLRRAADLRRRPHRREVPQHPRDPDLQEEPGALRHRPGPPRHRPGLAGRRRRGLHRRDGLPPRRRAHRGRHLRHRVRRGARPGAAAAAAGPRRVPRRGDLHLRRGRRRSEGRAAGVRGRPELRRADLRRGGAGRPRPVRRTPAEGRRGGP